MTNKETRILIVEPVHSNACGVERVLNHLGYFSIARASDLEEGLLLSRFGGKLFSALIVSEDVAKPSAENFFPLLGFDISNIFIHSCLPESKALNMRVNGMLRSCTGLPDLRELGAFMRRVEYLLEVRLAKAI